MKPQKLVSELRNEADNRFYGRDEKDSDWLLKTLFRYKTGSLSTMPRAALNELSPVLPKDKDYTMHDDEIRRRLSLLKDDGLKRIVETEFLPLGRKPNALDPKIQTGLRETRNLHNFLILERLATVSEDEFLAAITAYRVNINSLYDRFKIPRPFWFQSRADDDYSYFD